MSTKSMGLAMEIAKRSRSKQRLGGTELRKDRLKKLLFNVEPEEISLDDDLDLMMDEDPIEEPQAPSRKDRLQRILTSNMPKIGEK